MTMQRLTYALCTLLVLGALGVAWTGWQPGVASSHREAPMMMLDPTADITDVYAFVSPEAPETVTLMMNVIPFQDPNGGPNFYRFDPNVLYTLRVDNDGDAREDVVYEFHFEDALQNGGTFLYNTGPIGSPQDAAYNFRQTYSVVRVDSSAGSATTLGTMLTTPPEHIGPASTPNYESLAEQAIYDLGNDTRVFAGQRDDPFYVDLGAVFDLLTIRPGAPGNMGGGVDGVGGFNVHTIALQVPIADLTADGQPLTGADDPDAVLGVWATTSRRSMIVINGDGTRSHEGDWVQVSRLGQPLINEVIVPLAFKDFFNSSEPRNDLANYGAPDGPVFDPELAGLLNALYGVNVPPAPRNTDGNGNPGDILNLLIGFEGLNRPMNADAVQPAEMIRLNAGIPPVPVGDEGYSRLGVLGGDLGGYPNGRRVGDDVTDISLRVVAGVLVDGFNISPNNALGDGVNANDRPYRSTFPYAATPWQGFEHDHHPLGSDTGVGTQAPRDVPQSFGLLQNYPNPFNPTTRISYELSAAGPVSIAVYDIQGRLVKQLVDRDQAAGTHAVTWDGTDQAGRRVASGTYLYRMAKDGQVQARKMLLIK